MMFLKKSGNEFNLFDEFQNMFSKSKFMASDLKERENEYEINVDVPGVDKKDIKISLENKYLVISCDHQETKNENEDSHYVVKERFCESASRSFYVGDINESSIKANLKDGILTVIVPKEQIEHKQNYIEIE